MIRIYRAHVPGPAPGDCLYDSPTRSELCYLHFIDEKAEALRGWMTAQGSYTATRHTAGLKTQAI